MAPSFDDSPLSSLECVEDTESVFLFDDNDNPSAVESPGHGKGCCFDDGMIGEMGKLSEMALDEESLALFLKKESQYMPDSNYVNRLRSGDLDAGARKEAVDWIKKVHARFGFGPLTAYLSISYFDRFLSVYRLPKGQAWMTQLLAVACLSLAAKLEELQVPLPIDLQVEESKWMFQAKNIARMELLVLSKLSWRMQAVTPFSFFAYFMKMINCDKMPPKVSITKSTQIISNTVEAVEFWEFKPSAIAAAVALSVLVENQTVEKTKALLLLSYHVEKGKVLACVELMRDLKLVGGSPKGAGVASVPQSPMGVLDASCLSYRSYETAFGSCDESSRGDTTQTKKARLDR